MPPSRTLRLCLLLLPAACGSVTPGNPVRVTLTNRSGRAVDGAILRFDRAVTAVDHVSGPWREVRVRVSPPDTVRVQGGRLDPGASVSWDVAGAGGAPRLAKGRWLVGDSVGPVVVEGEVRVR